MGSSAIRNGRAIYNDAMVATNRASGLAPRLPPSGPAVAQIRIRRTAGRPRDSMVAVKHHGCWYSIDSTDGHSKATFRLIEAIMTARIADSWTPASRGR